MKVPRIPNTWKNILEAGRRPGRTASLPLSPKLLESKRLEMEPKYYEWLFLSVWFGLRPREVDNLLMDDSSLWYFTEDSEEGILSVFQQKLFERGLPAERCWKHIPIEFKEQKVALIYIREKKFSKPTGSGGRFMPKTFGYGFKHYAGRINFSGMLKALGYSLEERRDRMGHLSTKTTEEYDRKNKPPVISRRKFA